MSQEMQNIDSTFLNEVKKNSGLTIAVGIIVVLGNTGMAGNAQKNDGR